jgi:two-component system cell cycle response regulator DivK
VLRRLGERPSKLVTFAPLVLIVEDHEDTRSAWSLYFRGEGYVVITATNGNEAIARALGESPDAIVMDLLMPCLDGWETAALLRSYGRTHDIPIVACSAVGDGTRKARALAAGCDAFVEKPCMPGELEQAIRRVLGA